ncbi:MAG: hypothetical protein KDN20_18075 [Verrucomicrobiae bacterium]|nr:hypothetical protein [Verrucomicrobiae bacterium]
MKIRPQILETLQSSPGGLSSRALAQKTGLDCTAESIAAVSVMALVSGDIRFEEERWKPTKSIGATPVAILAVLENYARTTGKRIFRASAALQFLSAEQQPTADDLQRIVEESGHAFELLPNSMIKYKR